MKLLFKSLQLFCCLLAVLHAAAQGDPGAFKRAGQLQAEGKFAEAAALFELAALPGADGYPQKFKAAENYYRARDYAEAAKCYAASGDYLNTDALGPLHFARSLKQSGQYPAARRQFEQFVRQYSGNNKAVIMGIAINEIKGCELAEKQQRDSASSQENSTVQFILARGLQAGLINPYGLALLSDLTLYFSIPEAGRPTFMCSRRRQPAEPADLPASVTAHFGSGTFSTDGNRFYFTQTEPTLDGLHTISGQNPGSQLYVIRKKGDVWSDPEWLREYINLPGSTNLYPFTTTDKGVEYVYFASDRPGGFGGLDLYVMERPADSNDLDFSLPKNLGYYINTPGDEITPFWDPAQNTLWFSSNGLTGIGGYDIFQSTRVQGHWKKPENAGIPINSPADDFSYVRKKSGNGGYLVSNRRYGNFKPVTTRQDIFEFNQQ
jgi:tetratricopeptide (TPR) repeat protein